MRLTTSLLAILVAVSAPMVNAETPIVIAHRGASGYLPEHTLAAKALAHGMGADYLEQDVVLTKDDQPIVLHDIHLDTVTNVAEVFPARRRDDGRYYAIDFTLAEVKQLRASERFNPQTKEPVFPKRFPPRTSYFTIPTLAEELELIQGLNKSSGHEAGIYTEIKAPAWHRDQGKDISKIVLAVLARFRYRERRDAAYVQCFDVAETKRLRHELHCRLKLVQLLGDNNWTAVGADFDRRELTTAISEVAEYADGIGPRMSDVVRGRRESGDAIVTSLVEVAHEHGLVVHPYTLRSDALPDYTDSFDELVKLFFVDAKVDGVFTDFPDLALGARDRHQVDRRRQTP
ncbi:MAG: glycerophosphodiester phosphodiesterase [Planctomycetota bacterium]|nr:glycerophosphodiester phosphodiesterase [Planctomycetota bacterium]